MLATLLKLKGDQDAYIGEIAKRSGFSAQTAAKILTALRGAGWVTTRTEDPPPSDRLARRYYRLTDQGAAAARAWLGKRTK